MASTPLLDDPDCGFCRVCVAVILSWDRPGRLKPVALGTDEANDLLRGMPEAEQMASWHVVVPGCEQNVPENDPILYHPEIWSGGAAFSVLFRLLPWGGAFALITDRFAGAADRGYRWVAHHRGAFGRVMPTRVRRWADRVISETRPGSR